MIVNVNKSNVVVFRKGGRLANSDKFYYKGNPMEIRNEYNYLGILFSSHGVFHKASKQALSKGKIAIANIKNIMVNTKMESWDARMTLYKSIVKATLLYAAEIWGMRYDDVIEKCQTFMFKSIYCLPRNTPNYMLRIEMGVVKLQYYVFKQVINWWHKILQMSTDRYPRLCYQQLVTQDLRASNIHTYNWVSQLKSQLVQLGHGDVWLSQDTRVLKEKKDEILAALYQELISKDWIRLNESSYNSVLKEIIPRQTTDQLEETPASYLRERMPINQCRTVAQLRLSGSTIKLNIAQVWYSWDTEAACMVCDQNQKESLEHFLLRCPLYQSIRDQYLRDPGMGNFPGLLIVKNKKQIGNLFYYVQEALKTRAFALNE